MHGHRHTATLPFRRREAAGRGPGTRRGTLFLVVGPSGAGKDTLIRGARRALAGDARFEFARRVITRPAGRVDEGGEFHLPVDFAEFERLEREGAFCLSWRAHGLAYGLPAGIADGLTGGRSVIANASRTIVDSARKALEPVCVIHVTAPHHVLAARLRSREREDERAIASRLRRARARVPGGTDVIELRNDTTPEQGVRRLVDVLLREIRGSGAQRTASGVVVREPGLPAAAAEVLP